MNNSYPNNYGTPIQTGSIDHSQVIMVNQLESIITFHPFLAITLGTSPVFMNCPFFKVPVLTNVVKHGIGVLAVFVFGLEY